MAGLHHPKFPSTSHTSYQHSLPLSRSLNRFTNSPGMWKTSHLRVCVWLCVRDSVRMGFFLSPSDSAAPLLASLECQPAHTITTPSRPVSGRNDRGIQGSESKYLFCGFMPGITWILNNMKYEHQSFYSVIIVIIWLIL